MLLDLGLPDMEGVDIIRKVRGWTNMPIIVISARSEDADKVEALDAGADDYLTKPFSVDELLARLRVALRRVNAETSAGGESTVYENGSLRIDYHAESDRPTVINMTNHSYFNLSGDLASSIHDHLLMIDAGQYTPVDATMIPLAAHRAVEGTPFDFRTAKPIGRDIAADDAQLRLGRGYDHNFVLCHRAGHPSAVLTCPRSGIRLEVTTDAPGLQLYTGNFLDGVAGRGGTQYPRRSAVCLEAQQYPDSPNRNWPESTGRLRPGEVFESTTIFKFKKS
jgi:aldose 1-epimerase